MNGVKVALSGVERIRGMLDRRECVFLYRLAEKVVREVGAKSVLCEIGSFCGKSTVSIAKALVKHNAGVLYAIDWHQGSPSFPGFGTKNYKTTYNEFMDNIEKFGVQDRVRVIPKRSEEFAGEAPGEIHFLWIDGRHDYEGVKADFENYEGKLARGGFLLFHDACWTTWTEPFQFIKDRVLNNRNYNFYAMAGNTLAFRKESNATSQTKKNILEALCGFVSGMERPWYKRLVSAVLFRLTTCRTMLFHDWTK